MISSISNIWTVAYFDLSVVLKSRTFGLFVGLSLATGRPSKQPTPKPSCPKGLVLTWAPSCPSSIPVAQWLCCKNSDKTGDCKVGQAPFPYGPRRKLVCCQCPTGQVLNKDKNGCLPTGSPTPSLRPTAKPTSTLTAVPTTVPTPASTSPPTAVPTSQPGAVPTPVPTYLPTPTPSYPPTVRSSQQPTLTDCRSGSGYHLVYNHNLQEEILGAKYDIRPSTIMCCKTKQSSTDCVDPDHVLYVTNGSPTVGYACCYCQNPNKEWNKAVELLKVPGYCIPKA